MADDGFLYPQLLSNGGGVAKSAGSQFGEPSFTFGGQRSLMAVRVLFIDMAGGVFIPQE